MDGNKCGPIHQELRDLVLRRVLDGSLPEGEAVPPVRELAADLRLHHRVVSRAYGELVEQGLLEWHGESGACVARGARASLREIARASFLVEEIPAFLDRARALGLGSSELLNCLRQEEKRGRAESH